MAVRLFKLTHVPDEEAEAVRLLLAEHDISFYETRGGNWGVGTPAIWLHDAAQLDLAKSLIDAYQERHSADVRAQFEVEKERGEHATHFGRFRQHPFLVTALVLVSLLILYATLSPFLNFGK